MLVAQRLNQIRHGWAGKQAAEAQAVDRPQPSPAVRVVQSGAVTPIYIR